MNDDYSGKKVAKSRQKFFKIIKMTARHEISLNLQKSIKIEYKIEEITCAYPERTLTF